RREKRARRLGQLLRVEGGDAPHLRMVFVENRQWVPWTLKDLARRLPQQRRRTLPENPLKAYRLCVACQSDDDLPYVLTYPREDTVPFPRSWDEPTAPAAGAQLQSR